MASNKQPKIIHVFSAVFTRSEAHPIAPLFKAMREQSDFKLDVLDLTDVTDRIKRIQMIEWNLNVHQPDMVICGFDRPEMVDLAYSAYHRNIPIAQIFAGDISGGAFDDADRFVISNYSSMLFTSDFPAFERLQKAFMWKHTIRDKPQIFCVGATHFDGMDFNPNPMKTDKKYGLVLYNPPNKGDVVGQINSDLEVISVKLADFLNRKRIEEVYWVAPNGDYGSDRIISQAKLLRSVTYIGDMAHRDFLGLLKGADFIMGNSSCMFYEGAFFGIQPMQIGKRNQHRERITTSYQKRGASAKIVEHIREYFVPRDKK